MQPRIDPSEKAPDPPGHAPDKQHGWSLLDRPVGNFSEGEGSFTLAEGPPGVGGHMDSVHAFGPGSIGWALVEHYRLTGDKEWFRTHAPRIMANVEWPDAQRVRQVILQWAESGAMPRPEEVVLCWSDAQAQHTATPPGIIGNGRQWVYTLGTAPQDARAAGLVLAAKIAGGIPETLAIPDIEILGNP